jgi:hypothetical protein
MATRHQEWFQRWARCWAQNATAAIRRYQEDIAELRDQVWGTSVPAERASIEELIEDLEDAITSIRQQHQRWQRRAKRCWSLDMEDLAA